MTLASSTDKPSKTFDELMSTPIDFSTYIMNGMRITNLTQEILLGPTFRLLKGTRTNYAELEYNFKECYKALLEKLNWENPKGGDYPFDITKTLPFVLNGNRQLVLVDYFFNNDLKYLHRVILTLTYTTSLTKTKAAQYDLPGIKDMVLNIWSPVKVAYDKHALWGISQWRDQLRRADNDLYKFKEGDFPRLHINDIKDMLLLVVQNRLTNILGLQKAWGTRLKFSTAFHPQTDGQSERTIQTLENMLRSCALEWTGNWDDYIFLVEFAYNNNWHASIKCASFEMLYGRKCRALICWDQVGERVIEGPKMIEVTNEKVVVAKEKLKEARTHQKSYADNHRTSLEFHPGDHIFLKVSPTREVRRFGSESIAGTPVNGRFVLREMRYISDDSSCWGKEIIMANVPPNDPNVDASAIVHALVNPDHAPTQPVGLGNGFNPQWIRETPFTSPVIPDVDGQHIPPIASFGQNFHFDESSSTANLLTGNSKIVPIGPMCLNLGTASKRLGKMEKLMSERIDTKGRM
nr:putative nucleotidyltransferase, ribonuclease H [Tanacetum cinerariifolium]